MQFISGVDSFTKLNLQEDQKYIIFVGRDKIARQITFYNF
jgi:hypothetical protein